MDGMYEETCVKANKCLNQGISYLILALEPKNNHIAKDLFKIAETYLETADIYRQTAEIEAQNMVKREQLNSRLEKLLSSELFTAVH